MKKIVGFLMAVIMCLGIVTPLTVFAEGENAPTYVYNEDFASLTTDDIEVGKFDTASSEPTKNWSVYSNYSGCLTVTENKTLKIEHANSTALTAGVNIASKSSAITGKDFVLSFDFYSNNTGKFELYFDDYKDNNDNDTAVCKLHLSNHFGSLEVTADGSSWTDTGADFPTEEWCTVEIIYHYDTKTSEVTTFSVRLDGTLVAKDIATAGAPIQIDGWRFKATKDDTYQIDNWKVSLGDPYFYELSDGTQYFRNDFNQGAIDDDGNINAVERVINQYVPSTGAASKIENGLLHLENANSANTSRGEYQIRLFANTDTTTYNYLMGDMTVSFKIKPGANFTSSNFITAVRTNGTGASNVSGDVNVIKFTGGNVVSLRDESLKKSLSSDEFGLVELMFTYDWESGLYSSVSAYVNGELLDTTDVSDRQLHFIDYFKTMQGFDATNKDDVVDVDWVNIAKGHNSLFATPITTKTGYVGYQATSAIENKFNLRFVAVMTDEDVSNYEYVGFKVKATYSGGEKEERFDITEVYKSILATDGSGYIKYEASQLGGKYIFALNCLNLPSNEGAITFEVTTYYKLKGEAEQADATKIFTVDPATDDIPQGAI